MRVKCTSFDVHLAALWYNVHFHVAEVKVARLNWAMFLIRSGNTIIHTSNRAGNSHPIWYQLTVINNSRFHRLLKNSKSQVHVLWDEPAEIEIGIKYALLNDCIFKYATKWVWAQAVFLWILFSSEILAK